MRSYVLCMFLVACGGASTEQGAVTIAPMPEPTAAVTVNASVAPPPPRPTAQNRPTEIAGTNIRFAGGDGAQMKSAIVIHGAKGEMDGVAAEYKYLALIHGPRDVGFRVTSQSLLEDGNRSFDQLDIVLKDGTALSVFFDISEYFGKF